MNAHRGTSAFISVNKRFKMGHCPADTHPHARVIGELLATIAAQGIAPSGPVFTHHLRRPTDTFDFEISVSVSAPVVASGRVQPGTWPAMKVARTFYHGAY